MNIELISIDLSNYCSKQCTFCYNNSTQKGNTFWKPKEVIDFALDCHNNGGVQAISLGGGEPFEYEGIFEIINALMPQLFVSITTNGLPLLNTKTLELLNQNKPDKIHMTIHQPRDANEVNRVIDQVKILSKMSIKSGINLFVSADMINECSNVYTQLIKNKILPNQIILVPRKYSLIPTLADLSNITNQQPFQSTFCLTKCIASTRFCSISWDKKVSMCSYTPNKIELNELTFNGLLNTLKKYSLITCLNEN